MNLQSHSNFGLVVSLSVILIGVLYFNPPARGKAPLAADLSALSPTDGFSLLPVPEPSHQIFTIEGAERKALVFPPSAPSKKNGAPVVFVFHGHGGNSQAAARKFRIQTHWPEAIVIYPQGLPSVGKSDPEGKKSGWQKKVGHLNDRDLKFFDAMLEWAKKQYKCDTSRIYVAGHSNGGAMTYVLWSARSRLIAAFAPCAAVFGREVLSSEPKPAILLAGERDEVVPFENQERNISLILRLNQCKTPGVVRGKELTFYKSKIGAHVMTYVYAGAHPLPQNSGEVITKFFKDYVLH